MTTSIDPSIDELLLLEDNAYQMSNLAFANIKPIGAERKRGKLSEQIPTDFVSKDMHQSTKSSSISIENSRFNYEFEPHYSFINENSTIHSFHHQPKTSSRLQTAKTIPLFSPIIRFPPPPPPPSLCQSSTKGTFLNICQQTRSPQPIFTNPFHSTRERFQVNSIGRPIFRTQNYNYFFRR